MTISERRCGLESDSLMRTLRLMRSGSQAARRSGRANEPEGAAATAVQRTVRGPRRTTRTLARARDLLGENDVNQHEHSGPNSPDGWPSEQIECDQCTGKGLSSEGCRRCDGHGYLYGNTPLGEMAKLAKRRKHHALPEWYQKNFANAKNEIFYWKKGDQRVQIKHPAAIFFKLDAYNVFDDDGNLITDGESVYAWLDSKAKQAVDRTIDAYSDALRTGSREVNAPRSELEVLTNMLVVKDISFHEEAVDRYKAGGDHQSRRRDDQLARVAVVKNATDLAQERHPKLMAADFAISGHTEAEGLIFGDGVISSITDGTVQLRVLPLTPKIAAVWAWPEHAFRTRRNGNRTVRGTMTRKDLVAINGALARKSRSIAGQSGRQIERFQKAHARRMKRAGMSR